MEINDRERAISVITGLEDTLQWMKNEFNLIRLQVSRGDSIKATVAIAASAAVD